MPTYSVTITQTETFRLTIEAEDESAAELIAGEQFVDMDSEEQNRHYLTCDERYVTAEPIGQTAELQPRTAAERAS